MELAGEAAGYEPMSRSAADAAMRVRTGMGFDEAMAQMRFLPRRIRQMLAGVERTGDLERRLDAAAEHSVERRDASVNVITGAAVGVGVVTGLVVVLLVAIIASRMYAGALSDLGLL